ncbi:MAG: DsbA family protein, partial [Pseudomonadota bacterium]
PNIGNSLSTNFTSASLSRIYSIFGPNSAAVHTVAMAFHSVAPEKYYNYHVKMMQQEGQIDEARALEIAAGEGVDMEALTASMENQNIVESFRQTDSLASGLGITGTPSYIIGDEVVVGALGKDVLIEKIDNFRKCGSTRC